MVPAAIGEVPGEGTHSSTHHLVGILVEVNDSAEQQEVPEAQEQHVEKEDESQRGTGRQPMRQVPSKDCGFLSHEQAAEGEQEGMRGDSVAPPLVASCQAAATVRQLVEQQPLGQRLKTGARQVLNEQESTASPSPYCCPYHQPA